MNTRRCLQIADAMHELLLRELGEGVDGLRMIAEPLYARDVLLVCDALEGTEAATLARHYRIAANERDAAAAGTAPAPDDDAAEEPRFGPTTVSGSDSFFGPPRSGGPSSQDPPAESGTGPDGAARARRWFSPSRWLGGR